MPIPDPSDRFTLAVDGLIEAVQHDREDRQAKDEAMKRLKENL